jgi:hypothetical protein
MAETAAADQSCLAINSLTTGAVQFSAAPDDMSEKETHMKRSQLSQHAADKTTKIQGHHTA